LLRLEPQWANDYLFLSNVIVYFPCFVFGALVERYEEIRRIVMSQFGFVTSFILFWIVFFGAQAGYSVFSSVPAFYLYGLTGTIWILYLLKRWEVEAPVNESDATASKPGFAKRLGGLLARVGRRSLDVYVLHYFFLLWLPLQDYASVILGNGFMFELVVSIVLASLVATCAMTLSAILRSSDFLAFVLLGDWSKRPHGLAVLRPKTQSGN
jgi:hypothetical protein